jgi:hypothetical protein
MQKGGPGGPPFKPGAGNGTRTRDNYLGKVELYQLSYSRSSMYFALPSSGEPHTRSASRADLVLRTAIERGPSLMLGYPRKPRTSHYHRAGTLAIAQVPADLLFMLPGRWRQKPGKRSDIFPESSVLSRSGLPRGHPRIRVTQFSDGPQHALRVRPGSEGSYPDFPEATDLIYENR